MRSFLTRLLTVALIPVSYFATAQENENTTRCHALKNKMVAKTTVASVAEDNYDVKYVKFDLNVSNTSTYIAGNVTTTATVVASSLSTYVFELNTLLTIDSVLINGAIRPFTTAGVVRTVTLAAPLPMGTAFTAQVFYTGTPTSGTLFGGALGVNCIASPSWGNRATYTLSESYHANEWWPCKQSLRDKIDSIDMWLTVPDTLKGGSNGKLVAVTTVDATHKRFEWKERYPIDYYLISFAVANYVDYSYYMHFSASTDSMLVQNYVYSNPGTLLSFQSKIDSTGMMIDYFSTLYGRYPFWQEKYGHCMGPLGGGMEHQTMTTLGNFGTTLIAHELGHQWFGDNATCGAWTDIFVNEGFASYSEYLFEDHFWNHTAAINTIRDQQTNVKSSPDGAIFVDDTTNEGRIFDTRLTYDKGACVIHMLRFVVNNDNTFFNILKTHQTQMRDSTATIADFKSTTAGITGAITGSMSIDTFFNQWAYGEGYPIYTAKWNQIGNDVWVKLDQTTSFPSSIPLFQTPIELKLRSAAGDTIVRVFNAQASQVYHFTWDRTMNNMVFDPNYWLVYDLTSLTHDVTLDVNNVATLPISIMPNPASADWTVNNLPANSSLALLDLSGRLLWQNAGNSKAVVVPATNLATGMYLLQVKSDAGSASYKLIKE
ncbi:hypothetical protein CJD36_011695 [Flavipsychrobacter stenotrophus]|uniref:Aminopeptidase N n=1 Tax=Flavipsychrobacter stenotrophus TaxID=2077091 RepID=A0A2S7SUN1_9BACT|nr:M1 family aminopeptidase [Flavipsychrobacter stenotrophus]PQJ10629.1 hypothetical protein CJD36_011695 [Flavipsychrobacter stenotrophus]